MSTGGTIAIVLGVIVIVFLAVNRGLISSGVQVGVGPGGVTSTRGIVAPQPTSNYGGYLAASTAPGVSSALNGALTGLGGAFASWLSPSNPPTTAPAQGSTPSSPSLSAQPVGPASAAIAGWNIGPSVDPGVSYDATSASAFAYDSLAADNSYDPNASLAV